MKVRSKTEPLPYQSDLENAKGRSANVKKLKEAISKLCHCGNEKFELIELIKQSLTPSPENKKYQRVCVLEKNLQDIQEKLENSERHCELLIRQCDAIKTEIEKLQQTSIKVEKEAIQMLNQAYPSSRAKPAKMSIEELARLSEIALLQTTADLNHLSIIQRNIEEVDKEIHQLINNTLTLNEENNRITSEFLQN